MKPNTTATVTDPVCGMAIDPAKAVGSSRYLDVTYHFCSRGCETRFDANPQQYAGGTAQSSSPRTSGHSCCGTK